MLKMHKATYLDKFCAGYEHNGLKIGCLVFHEDGSIMGVFLGCNKDGNREVQISGDTSGRGLVPDTKITLKEGEENES